MLRMKGLEWLEAHRGKPLAMLWYLGEVQQTPPIPAHLGPHPNPEGAWPIDTEGLTRVIDQKAIAAARVADKHRLVIEYGKRRLVLEERDDG
jgi:hypothetical protein